MRLPMLKKTLLANVMLGIGAIIAAALMLVPVGIFFTGLGPANIKTS